MSKIAIIRTPFVYPSNHTTSITAVPDIGTAYISGALQSAGHNSFIVDAPGESIGKTYKIAGTHLEILGLPAEEIVRRIPSDIEMIGLQAMHSNRWIYDAYIVRALLKAFPGVPIFLGGEHVTACADIILGQIPEIAACVIGEGDETVVELVEHLNKGLPLEKVKGLAFIKKGKEIVFTERRPRISDLDKLARPSWSNVPIQKYLDNHCCINSLSRRAIPMIASRGCPHSCTFCTVPNMWTSRWYVRSHLDVIEEIKSYIEAFGINHVDFVDLTIGMNRKWIKDFCEALIQEKLGITWAIPIGTRTENLDSDLLKLMEASGLRRVLYSAESGAKNTLKNIDKKLDIQHFNKIVKETSDLGICVKVALIFGFPGQTFKDIFQTFLFVNRLAYFGVSDLVCMSFVPYPKTKLFKELHVAYDYNSTDHNIRLNNDLKNMKSWSEHFGDRTLKGFIWFFTLYFYAAQGLIRPLRVWKGFYRVFVIRKPHTNFESIVFNMFLGSKSNAKRTYVDWQEN